MTLTKEKFANELFEKVGINKGEASNLVDAFFGEILTKLKRTESVKLPGFGNFELRDKKQPRGRNPKTGEEHLVTARRVVTFHPGLKLKNMVVNNHQV